MKARPRPRPRRTKPMAYCTAVGTRHAKKQCKTRTIQRFILGNSSVKEPAPPHGRNTTVGQKKGTVALKVYRTPQKGTVPLKKYSTPKKVKYPYSNTGLFEKKKKRRVIDTCQYRTGKLQYCQSGRKYNERLVLISHSTRGLYSRLDW